MSEPRALELARKVGHSLLGNIGAEAFAELELAYATRLLPKFKDNPTLRIRQNVLFYWPPSYLKSVMINQFVKTIPTTLPNVDVTYTSREVLFGSFDTNKNDVIPPILLGKSFLTITELMSFLGQSEAMRDKVNTMNKVLEGEDVTRHLLKLFQPGFPQRKISNLASKGIRYDPLNSELAYKPDLVTLAASRPLENKKYTYLKTSGHLNRYHIIQRRFPTKEVEKILRTEHKIDKNALAELRRLNLILAGNAQKSTILNYPSNNFLKPATDALIDCAKNSIEINDLKLELADIINLRTLGNLVREMTSHAFLRNPKKLDYTDVDRDYVIDRIDHFVEPEVFPSLADAITYGRINKVEHAKGEIQLALEKGPLSRKALMTQIKSKERTADRAIQKMKGTGEVSVDDKRRYVLGTLPLPLSNRNNKSLMKIDVQDGSTEIIEIE